MKPAETRQPTDDGQAQASGPVLRVVLVYAVFAGLWILVSDEMAAWLIADPAQLLRISLLKGWLFVAVTSLLLYVLIRRLLAQALQATMRELAAQQDTARARQLLLAISDHSPDAIFAKDLQGRYLLFNREAARIVGTPAAQVLGRDDTALFPPPQAATIGANDRRVLAEQRINTYEEALSTADGERIYQATKGPLRDESGQVIGLFGVSRDITERKQAEAELRRTLEELQRFNRLTVNRELDMVRLKQQVNALSLRLGEAPPHALDFAAVAEDAAAGANHPGAGADGEPR